GEVVSSSQLALAPADAIGTALDRVLQVPQTHFAVAQGGQLCGVISRNDVVSAASSRGLRAFVAGSMQREVMRVDAALPLVEVQDRVLEAEGSPVAVHSDGVFLGLLTSEDLWRVGSIIATLGR